MNREEFHKELDILKGKIDKLIDSNNITSIEFDMMCMLRTSYIVYSIVEHHSVQPLLEFILKQYFMTGKPNDTEELYNRAKLIKELEEI